MSCISKPNINAFCITHSFRLFTSHVCINRTELANCLLFSVCPLPFHRGLATWRRMQMAWDYFEAMGYGKTQGTGYFINQVWGKVTVLCRGMWPGLALQQLIDQSCGSWVLLKVHAESVLWYSTHSHCLWYWHPTRAQAQAPADPTPIQLPATEHGKAAADAWVTHSPTGELDDLGY